LNGKYFGAVHSIW